MDGTLGNLQTRIQSKVVLPVALTEEPNEIRERRNAMIHNGDKASAKYVRASTAVLPRAHPYVGLATIGHNVTPTQHI